MSVDLQTLTARVLAESRKPFAMDLIFDELDDSLLSGDIEGVRGWLASAAGSQLSIAQFLGALTITHVWRSNFEQERSAIVSRVRSLDPDRASELLRGFE